MIDLRPLTERDIPAVLEFEVTNRAYFTRTISDRGDDYFEHFTERLQALIDEQRLGLGAYYLLVGDGPRVLGRFNLVLDAAPGVALLGYRVAEAESGRGLATSTVRELCRRAREHHGARVVRAATADSNPASRRVLEKAGFHAAGIADPSELGGRTGQWHELEL